MKKFFKVVGGLAVIGAAVAGGLALYKKLFAPKDDFDDFDDLEDSTEEEAEVSDRGYVSLNPSGEEDAKESTEEEKSEETSDGTPAEEEKAADTASEE